MSIKYIKITEKELQALINTADSCVAIGDELADEAMAAVEAYKAASKRNGQITIEELQALIDIADSCESMGGELAGEAKAATKAYNAVLKRNGLVLEERQANHSERIDNIR